MESSVKTSHLESALDGGIEAASHQVIFAPSGLSSNSANGSTVLAAAQDAGVAIRSLCGGNGNCRQCWVKIVEGSHSKHGINVRAENVSAPTQLEEKYRTKIPRFKDLRLACRTHICGDLLVDVPESSQEHLTIISKSNANLRVHRRRFPQQFTRLQIVYVHR